MKDQSENRFKVYASIGTITFHGLILILLFFALITTPIPPYPEAGGGGGLEVNLGYMDEGTGEVQPEEFNPNPVPYNKNITGIKSEKSDQENILTHEEGEAVALKTGTDKKTEKETNREAKTEIKINDPVVNPNALFKKHNTGGSEGETGSPGDQGNKDGSLYSKNHYGTGLGDGSGIGPGSGSGKGSGKGPGTGSGEGPGISYSLKDRSPLSLPKPNDISQKEGKVVVEIKVNSDGAVVYANAGIKGSTTTDVYLCKIAKEAALKARFSKKTGAPDQIGTITYHFVLQ
jgi:outer membrane biosynthesis protein TonB